MSTKEQLALNRPVAVRLVPGKVRIPDERGNWYGCQSDVETTNPAWILVDILTNRANQAPMYHSAFDYPMLKRWADYCEFHGLSFHYVFDYDDTTTVIEAVNKVAKAGHAHVWIEDGKCVLRFREPSSLRQHGDPALSLSIHTLFEFMRIVASRLNPDFEIVTYNNEIYVPGPYPQELSQEETDQLEDDGWEWLAGLDRWRHWT